ncbi:MAG: cupin domain-containing protein [Candidatus Bathyarchaeia archaeon]|jgi:mannose-6-phosphate isomerase-like protein (cupin superfamily)
MHVSINEVKGVEISPRVIERLLLSRDQSTPGGLEVKHHLLTGGEVVFDEQNVEYQHYVVSGCARMGGRFIHGETTLFVPGNSRFGEKHRHVIAHAGEGELRFVTASYKIPRPNFRWAKTRSRNLYQAPISIGNINNQQLITEEEHAVMGALRMHALDVQTHPPLAVNPEHKNPEEIMYILRGEGKAICGNETYKVTPGSLIYSREGEIHGIYNTSEKLPLQYFVLEFIEHDKMWTERGYHELNLI